MADTVLRVKIEGDAAAGTGRSPSPTTQPPPPQPAGRPASDDWYAAYHELKNRSDRFAEEGKRLSPGDMAELARLHGRLMGEAARSTAGQPAGGDVADMRQFLLQQGGPFFNQSSVSRMTDQAVRDMASQVGYQPPQAARQVGAADEIEPIAEKLKRGTITLDEAIERAEKVVRRWGDTLTDELRQKGAIGTDQTADDFIRERMEVVAEQHGRLPVGRRLAKATPIASPVPPDVLAKEAAEREAAEQARRADQIRDVTAGARTMAVSRNMVGRAAGAAQVGASGLFGSQIAAAAAGPVGIAIAAAAIAEEIGDAVTGGIQRSISGVADVGKRVAGNDGRGLLADSVSGAGEALDAVTIGLNPFSAGLKIAGTTIKEFNSVVDAVVSRGRELAAFSGETAGAAAQADVRALLMDVKEARHLGPDFARVIEQQSQLDASLRELLLPIKTELVKLVSDGLTIAQAAVVLLGQITTEGQEIAAAIRAFIGTITGGAMLAVFDRILVESKKLVAEAEEARRAKEREAGEVGLAAIRNLAEKMDQLQLVGEPNPDAGRLDRMIQIPLFQGLGG